ncbi:hypothetical protein CXB51_027709 [Gossypium anomalum]|uniref:Uncharacterized protein n=1 Tax=Gossypium anomalum TaxID=47600 RepID=A0A8J5Y998_9ROSI|nr:hypothetical protein CXB51_027709 [Gossypium anomalum]
MGSTVIDIPDGEGVVPCSKEKKKKVGDICCQFPIDFNKHMTRKVIHSVKVGVALVFVSLLYLLDPLYKQVGENAMWAIMTVVVVFEFFAGATLSKGINRGIGTVLGGGRGCLAAIFAQAVGGVGKAIIVGVTVFIFGAAATYTRQVPNVKKKFDYGAMIFILTFSLVVVSGLRAEQVLLVFPIWASDELHDSLIARFEDLAVSLEVQAIVNLPLCLNLWFYGLGLNLVLEFIPYIKPKERSQIVGYYLGLHKFEFYYEPPIVGFSKEYFGNVNEKEKSSFNFRRKCKSVLHSKTKDESLLGTLACKIWVLLPLGNIPKIRGRFKRFGYNHLSLKGCLKSPTQPSESNTCRQPVKEPCEAIVASLAWTLRELGESIKR